jgi:hypothetical protein
MSDGVNLHPAPEAEVAALADRIEAIIRDNNGAATHGELLHHLNDVDTDGEEDLELRGTNMVIMVGVNALFGDAVRLLLQEERMALKNVPFWVLLTDGCPIPRNMPLAKRPPPPGGFKKPRFCPCQLVLPEKR